MNLMQTLTQLNQSGVWAFVNERDKIVYLSYSNNFLTSVSRNVRELTDKSHSCRRMIRDKSKLQIQIIESNCHKARLGYWIDFYRNKGYSLYRNKNGEVTYKVRISISEDYKVFVMLVNKRNDKVVVGVFPNMEEAKVFSQTHYPDKIHKIVYSDNPLTKEFLRRKDSTV
jgi:hypothetical protein